MEVPITILIRDKTVLGILNIANRQLKKPIVVIMCYGFNGDRVEQHRMSVTMGRLFEENGINFCRFDFRNQGLSDGCFDNFIFTEKQEDITAIIDFMIACFRNDNLNIYLIGFSNGCKVAIDTICDDSRINGIILWNPILQELSTGRGEDAGDSRRLYRHPITGKPYKKFYSLRLNINLIRELNNDKSMTKLRNLDNDVLCILSKNDVSIKSFIEQSKELTKKKNLYIEYIDDTDHLFGSVTKVKEVINLTLQWILARAIIPQSEIEEI